MLKIQFRSFKGVAGGGGGGGIQASVLSFDSTAIRTHGPKGGSVISKYSNKQESFNSSTLPHAADILYGNTEGIKNRLRIFHLIRLEKQHILDHTGLVSIGKKLRALNLEEKQKHLHPIQLTTQWMTNEPGASGLFMPKIGAISIKFSFNSFFDSLKDDHPLKANIIFQRSFKLLVKESGYFSKNEMGIPFFSMEISAFPFKEMNKKFAFDSLKSLLEESCNNVELNQIAIDFGDGEIFDSDDNSLSSKLYPNFKPLGRSRALYDSSSIFKGKKRFQNKAVY